MKFENKAASVEVLLVMFLDEPVFFTSMLYLKELKVGLSLPPKIWTSLERHSQLYQMVVEFLQLLSWYRRFVKPAFSDVNYP